MKLVIAPNSTLNEKCQPCSGLHIHALVQAFAMLREHKGLGLAAPQVGLSQRWFITAWGEVFINPTVELHGTLIESREGCLSIPGKQFVVGRATEVLVQGRRYTGEQAIVIQHESNHLDGILISDIGVPT